jgi:hypothetical protein
MVKRTCTAWLSHRLLLALNDLRAAVDLVQPLVELL